MEPAAACAAFRWSSMPGTSEWLRMPDSNKELGSRRFSGGEGAAGFEAFEFGGSSRGVGL